MLPETNLDQAYQVAERIRKRVAQQEIKWKEEAIHYTASFGVTGSSDATPADQVTPEALIQQVDKNLYRSKQEGRNRTTAAPL